MICVLFCMQVIFQNLGKKKPTKDPQGLSNCMIQSDPKTPASLSALEALNTHVSGSSLPAPTFLPCPGAVPLLSAQSHTCRGSLRSKETVHCSSS